MPGDGKRCVGRTPSEAATGQLGVDRVAPRSPSYGAGSGLSAQEQMKVGDFGPHALSRTFSSYGAVCSCGGAPPGAASRAASRSTAARASCALSGATVVSVGTE
jgi:hypothetical protein